MNRWELEKRIEKIIDRNCVEYPYEGTEVYKQNIKDEIMELIEEIRKEKLEIRLHDVVILKDGREGTIIHVFKDDFFEIEFYDNKTLSVSIKDIDEVI
jgi:hypothetical protein